MSDTIFCDVDFPHEAMARLRDGLAGRDVLWSRSPQRSNLSASAVDPQIFAATIAFGQPSPEVLSQATRLRWIQLTSAGYSRFDDDESRRRARERGIILTTSSSVYADPCAEHLLAMMLALGRALPQSLDEQRGTRAWSADERRRESRLLRGQKVVILGYGAIARRLCQLLAPFEVELRVVRRQPRGDEGLPLVAPAALHRELANTDHLVNALPHNASTVGFVGRELLAALPARARFYNVGRGTTVDEEALLDALREGRLDASYLDVTREEPLPADHPLWTAPRSFVTPHTAGGQEDEFSALVAHFLDNLGRLEAGVPLADRVL